MKLINSTLHDKQLKTSDLPQDIKDDMMELKGLVLKFNETVKEYNQSEKDPVLEAKLDDMEEHITELEQDIVEKIKAYNKPEADPTPTPAPAAADGTPAPKKDSGIGWLVFGGVALVVTLGAVNLFKKR
jgi:hypothetical protein